MDGPCAGPQGPQGGHLLDHELLAVAWARVHQLLPDVSCRGILAPESDAC